MKMAKFEVVSNKSNPLELEYSQLSTRFDSDLGILWTIMKPDRVPCFTQEFLDELLSHNLSIANSGGKIWANGGQHAIRYSIAASGIPGVFNLGGELALFRQLIRSRNRQALMHYAGRCIDVIMPRVNHFNLPLTTISLVQGEALGGGFEAVLTSDIVIAERSSKMGFPEILFNLFPGMGAYSLLARKIGPAQAEKLITNGNIYNAKALHDLGVVDVLVEDGEGENAVYDYVRRQSRYANGYLAVQRARHRFNPVTYQEMMDIATIWVDAALELGEKDLKVMDRFVRSQQKLFGQDDPAHSNQVLLEAEIPVIYWGKAERRKIPRRQYA